MFHFFLEEQALAEEGVEAFPLRLTSEDMKHASVVRLTPGERIAVVDGARDYFLCEVTAFDGAELWARIASREERLATEPSITLVQGIAKGDKMETIVRHGTEVGVDRFIPFASERSIVRLDGKKAAAKRERWQAIARSAAMQAGRRAVPAVELPASLDAIADVIASADRVLIAWEEASEEATVGRALEGLGEQGVADPPSVAIVVGPEGGLSSQEVYFLQNALPQSAVITLGPYILRTETAGIVTPALVLQRLREGVLR